MRMKIALLTLLVLALASGAVDAGNSKRTGTAGAQELQIPVGARGVAMGGAVVANTEGMESVIWNPAGLALLEGTEAMFTHLEYMADINIEFVGVATAIEDFGTIAGSAKIVSIGDMEETTDDQPYGTGRIFDPTLAVVGVSYARILTANVNFGASAKFIHESIFEVSATGVAFDVGFLYNPNWHGVSMGIAIMNYGPEMSFSGRGFDRRLNNHPTRPLASSFDLPSHLSMGVAYNFLDRDRNYAVVSGNFRSNNFYEDFYQGGVEYVYDEKYSLRAGYSFADETHWLYGFSAGAGVVFPLGGTSITLEYTWRDVDVFEGDHFFTVKAAF